MLLRRAERYRIYPTPGQIDRMEAWEGSLRWLWNHAHTERIAKLEAGCLAPTAFDQMNDLTALRGSLEWLADVPRDVCAQLLAELDKAWQRGFKKLGRMPRYKSKNRGDRAPLVAPQSFRVEGAGRAGVVVFPKLGAIRAVIHRPLRGKPKTCAIVRDGDQWFASIVCEIEMPDPAPSTKPPVGIDRGVVNLLADSNGVLTPNPQPLKAARKRLATMQRRASHKKEKRADKRVQSKNEKRALACVAKLHRKARRQREAVHHRLSLQYAKNHGALIVERLDLCNMTASAKGTVEAPGKNVRQKAGLNRAILNAGWSQFLYMLRYKAEERGAKVIEVRAAYSSQECAACHHVAPENRRTQSEFHCVACGHRANADVNAAKVILRRGTHGAEGFGGDEVTRPVKKQLRVARRAALHVDQGLLSVAKAPAFMQG